ncbi:hypothetical protein A1O1_08092 [Capronia coronata CBS 617.96]|uniref:Uncharacterized protein n=1 Tax=Capronia coronata CBS 617.96 TaxID=1182541 RepID=W9YIA1_9EURO|nr:uncharacterized protein A1O1_08092 [Capronia coronata CBS 617.96]EXJ82024.1 hypothetical protein A1O1_08092 [Capronia coronata CBS 617.96]
MASIGRRPWAVSDKTTFLRSRETGNHTVSLEPTTIPAKHRSRQGPSLEQYRETVHEEVTKDLKDVQQDLTSSIDDLTVKVEEHFRSLNSIEEPLQRPFFAEVLNVQTKPNIATGEGHQERQEVLLSDRVAAFRKLRKDKELTLCKLWEDWEEVQFELIGLAAEVFGPESMTFAQSREEDMKPGQKEKLQKALQPVQGAHQQAKESSGSLEEDLRHFEASMLSIASKTKKTMTDMQQQYNIQKNKIFQGLRRHIELLAAL